MEHGDILKTDLTDNGILHITFNRPKQLNALNHQVLSTLFDILTEAKSNKAVKAILLSGDGKAFCAGADITELANLDEKTGVEFATFGQKVFRLLETLGKPSLAAIHGYAFGGGCEIAMSATMRIAAEGTQFGQPEIKLGVIPGFGGTQRLARLIGKGRALDICLTGRRFTAEEAFAWGMLSELVPQDQLLDRAKVILSELVQLGGVALASIMTTIDDGFDLTLDAGMQLEADYFGRCCATNDKAEGVSAFLEKRQPVFSGE